MCRFGWQRVQAPEDHALRAEELSDRPGEILTREPLRRRCGCGGLPGVPDFQSLLVRGKLEEHEVVEPEEFPKLLQRGREYLTQVVQGYMYKCS
jgi:hypothetical protein